MTSSKPRSRSRYDVSTRSQPPTSAPQAAAIAAYAERPAPPMPTNQIRRPSKGRKPDQLLGDLVRGVGLRDTPHRRAHGVEPLRVAEQRAREVGNAAELRLRDDDRSAAALEVARVQCLVVGGRERIGNEDRREPGGGKLPDRAARARRPQVRGAQGGAEVL